MSYVKSHNLFGLNPSVLKNLPTQGIHNLWLEERQIWRAPIISAILIKKIKQRLAKPRKYILPVPLVMLLVETTPMFTIKQYVKIATMINRQLVRYCCPKPKDPSPQVANQSWVCDMLNNCKNSVHRHSSNHNTYESYNDYTINAMIMSCRATYNDWAMGAQFPSVTDEFQNLLYFRPYFSSFTHGSCGVLTPKAVEYVTFVEDLCNAQHHIIDGYKRLKKSNQNMPNPWEFASENLGLLRLMHPNIYRCYQNNVANQISYTIRRKEL